MSVGPAELLKWANSNSIGADEVLLRASVSRAYYAAYHRCRAWHLALPMPGGIGTSDGSHEQLINQLLKPDKVCSATETTTSRKLGAALTDLKVLRTIADYETTATLLAVTAQEACQKSAKILNDAK